MSRFISSPSFPSSILSLSAPGPGGTFRGHKSCPVASVSDWPRGRTSSRKKEEGGKESEDQEGKVGIHFPGFIGTRLVQTISTNTDLCTVVQGPPLLPRPFIKVESGLLLFLQMMIVLPQSILTVLMGSVPEGAQSWKGP